MATHAFATALVRMTNMDLVAQELKTRAATDDFVVVVPWTLGISFRQYYDSMTPWKTLPAIADLRIHRYDTVKEYMALSDPLAPAMKQAEQTLRSGRRLWIVSTKIFFPTNRPPTYLAPAPYDPAGWNELTYTSTWLVQMEYFIAARASRYAIQTVKTTRPINPFENVQLLVVEGWRSDAQ